MTTAGAISTFEDPAGQVSNPEEIVTGPDGNLWFTNSGTTPARIGRITPAGAIATFAGGQSDVGHPTHLTSGPDGNLWFTTLRTASGFGRGPVGRITPSGAFSYTTDRITYSRGDHRGSRRQRVGVRW